jgi:hypothetical protein
MLVSREETFRPTFGRALAGVLISLCAVAALGVAPEGWGAIFNIWPWLALVSVTSWTCYWHPRVVVTDGGIQVVNPLRTFNLPWPVVIDIETKWALTICTSFGAVRAWAAPSPGRQVLRNQQPQDRRLAGLPKNASGRPSDLASTESGAAAQIVRQRWLRLIAAGPLQGSGSEPGDGGHCVRWHVPVIATLMMLAALAAASVVW